MNSTQVISSEKEIANSEIFRVELNGQIVNLKKGIEKRQVLQVLGTNRCVDISADCQTESWYYCFRAKTGNIYCCAIFRHGKLSDFKIGH